MFAAIETACYSDSAVLLATILLDNGDSNLVRYVINVC